MAVKHLDRDLEIALRQKRTHQASLAPCHSTSFHFSMLLLALLNTLLIATAAQQGDPTKDVCRRHGHQTCIIDSKLYIDGGLAYWGGSVGNDSKAEPSKLNTAR